MPSITRVAPKPVQRIFSMAGVSSFERGELKRTPGWFDAGGKIFVDESGSVLKGRGQFPEAVFFHGRVPVMAERSVRAFPPKPVIYQLIENDTRNSGLALQLLARRNPGERLTWMNVNALLEKRSVLGEGSPRPIFELFLNNLPSCVLKELKSSIFSWSYERPGKLLRGQYRLTVRLDSGFKKGELPLLEGYNVGSIALQTGQFFENPLRDTSYKVAQILLSPEGK